MKPTLRCSNLDRFLSCPGSLTLDPLVAPRVSDEGDEGTAIHYQIARNLASDLGAVGIFGEPGKTGINAINEWIVGYCVREVAENTPPDWSLEVEAAFAYEFERFILSGHIDALALSPDATEAIGWDYKTGYNAVDLAECNWQVAGYLVLVKRAYPQLKKAKFFIVQPRNDEEMGQQRVTKVEVEWSTVDFMTKNFVNRVNAALADPHTVNSGMKQCRFCPAVLQCPAIKLEIETMKAKLTPELLAAIQLEPLDSGLADICIAAKTLDAPFETARDLLKKRIEAKGYITASDGTNISTKKTAGSYEVTEPEQFHKELLTLIPASRLPYCTKPVMTAIKKEIAAAKDVPLTSKKTPISAEGLFDSKLRPYVTQGERTTLVYS